MRGMPSRRCLCELSDVKCARIHTHTNTHTLCSQASVVRACRSAVGSHITAVAVVMIWCACSRWGSAHTISTTTGHEHPVLFSPRTQVIMWICYCFPCTRGDCEERAFDVIQCATDERLVARTTQALTQPTIIAAGCRISAHTREKTSWRRRCLWYLAHNHRGDARASAEESDKFCP